MHKIFHCFMVSLVISLTLSYDTGDQAVVADGRSGNDTMCHESRYVCKTLDAALSVFKNNSILLQQLRFIMELMIIMQQHIQH